MLGSRIEGLQSCVGPAHRGFGIERWVVQSGVELWNQMLGCAKPNCFFIIWNRKKSASLNNRQDWLFGKLFWREKVRRNFLPLVMKKKPGLEAIIVVKSGGLQLIHLLDLVKIIMEIKIKVRLRIRIGIGIRF